MISILAQERLLGAALGAAFAGFIVYEQRKRIYQSISPEHPQSQLREPIFGKQFRSEFELSWNKAVDQTFGPLVASLNSRQSPAAAPVMPPPTTPVKAPPTAPSQAPSAQVATSPGPVDVIKILQKAGHFTVFVRLMQATTEDTELNKELNKTNNGITIFAPSDSAFSNLKAGFLNALSDEDKTELVKFHVLPALISSSQFQTVSNPVRTQAGTGPRVTLNVTTTGNFVNITTGLTNTSISGTVYTDSQFAIYQIDKVLFPLDIFTPKPPAPAPAPELGKPRKAAPGVESPTAPKDISGALTPLILHNNALLLAVSCMVAAIFS